MRDITLEDTIYPRFTTRAFATGMPTTLAGTPVISVYEENNLTQITTGVTLTVDYDSVTGLNQITIVATAANGYENGKSYDAVITTGTVGGVSVVGEVVFSFTIGASAAAVDLANGTDGLGAIKTDTASILNRIGAFTGSGINTILGFFQSLMRSDATDPSDLGGTYAAATDSNQAIRDRGDTAWTTGAGGAPPDLLQNTTIATLASQTSFTLTAGSADDDAYIGAFAIVTDSATAEQKAVGIVSDYVGATKTITLREDPGIFTMAIGDTIDIVANDKSGLNIGVNGANLTDLGGMSTGMTTEVGDAVLDEVVESTFTLRQLVRIFTSILGRKSTGGGTTTHAFRDIADTKDRIEATVDANGNRTSINTFDGS